MGLSPLNDPARLTSLDAYRGFIMLAMVSAGLGFPQVAKSFPDSPVWKELGYQFEHVTWVGGSFWDMIQPSFMFMVGVAMPWSHASRLNKGQSRLTIAFHVIYRALLLIALGVFLSSNGAKQTDFTFINVLSQIGLGYAFVYLLIGRGLVVQLLALAAILGGYWYWFYQFPAPSETFDYATVGFGPNKFLPYPFEPLTGMFAHWNPNTNAAWDFDHWFMNLFPRESPYEFNRGGYANLNFIPSMGTMLLGLMAGEMLKRTDLVGREKLLRLLFAALLCGLAGAAMGDYVCPLVKRIWTPSWTLYSAGWTFGMLAAFYLVVDLMAFRRLALPLVVVGMNSIAVYCMSQLLKPWVRDTLKCHFGPHVFEGTYFGEKLFDPVFVPIAMTTTFLVIVWLAAAWMYRQKIFIRI